MYLRRIFVIERMTKTEKLYLPKDVFYETIWIIRGYDRRKQRLKDIIDEQPDPRQPHVKGGMPDSPVHSKASRRERDRDIVAAVDKALQQIPKEYRKGVWDKVVHQKKYPDDADPSTYSRYRSMFIIQTAINLGYI